MLCERPLAGQIARRVDRRGEDAPAQQLSLREDAGQSFACDNLERIAAVREVYSEPRTVALETGSDWTAAIANEFLDACSAELMWVEYPEAHDKIHLVRDDPINTIAAGEKCTNARELYDLYTRGRLRKLIIDVQYVGGPVRWLEAARALNALGATVGAHRFSHYSVHMMASLPRSLPIEMLDWTNPAFHPLAGPDASGRLPSRGTGLSHRARSSRHRPARREGAAAGMGISNSSARCGARADVDDDHRGRSESRRRTIRHAPSASSCPSPRAAAAICSPACSRSASRLRWDKRLR